VFAKREMADKEKKEERQAPEKELAGESICAEVMKQEKSIHQT
jgi:hypothetical protein